MWQHPKGVVEAFVENLVLFSAVKEF